MGWGTIRCPNCGLTSTINICHSAGTCTCSQCGAYYKMSYVPLGFNPHVTLGKYPDGPYTNATVSYTTEIISLPPDKNKKKDNYKYFREMNLGKKGKGKNKKW